MTSAQGHCLFLFVLIHVVLKATSFSAEKNIRRVKSNRFRVRGDRPRLSIHRRQVTAKLILLPLLLLSEALFPVFAMSNNAAAKASLSSLEGTTDADATIGWGIVGLGDVVAVKSGPAFYKANGSKLVAVMRRTPGAAQAWIQNNLPPNISSCCRGYDNLDDFLKNSDLDAVYIATPPGSHLEIARKVAAAGKPAYIEKPVGRCGWETEAIVKVFEENGVPLYTAYVSRAYERTNAIINLLKEEKVVGDQITSITYKLHGSEMARGLDFSNGSLPWRFNATLAGGGLVLDVGCHVVDRIDYLCGPLVNVQGKAYNHNSSSQNVEDHVELTAEIGPSDWAAIQSEGATVKCIWDFSASESLDELTICGPGGSLQMAAMSPSSPIRILGPDGQIVRQLTFDPPQHAAQPLIQMIVNELRGVVGAVSPSRGDNALRTSKVLDKALDSYYGGRRDEFWTRPDTWPGRQQGGGEADNSSAS